MNVAVARVTHLLLVLLAVTFLAFSLIRLLPGDTVTAVLGENATPEDMALAREELHLNDPLISRYGRWLGDAVQGDLGRSYRTKEKVVDAIKQRVPVTLELVLLSQLLALAIAVPLAIVAAVRRGGVIDRIIGGSALAMLAAPSYMVAIGLMALFAVKLGWLPSGGFVRLTENPFENLKALILPVTALAVQEVASFMRLLRSDLIDTLQQDFIWLARAKGVSGGNIIRRHALRSSSVGLLTLAGVTLGRMMGGAVLIEVIYQLPGLGRYAIDAIANRDFTALQGALVVFTVSFVLINFLVDVAYGYLDPRTRV